MGTGCALFSLKHISHPGGRFADAELHGHRKNPKGENMTKEIEKKPKQKTPKFKDSYDEEFSWEDEMEIQTRRRKLGKKSQWKENTKENPKEQW